MIALKNVLFAQVVTFRHQMLHVNYRDNYRNRDNFPAIIAIYNIHKKPYRRSLV